jgi:hypothetical protein
MNPEESGHKSAKRRFWFPTICVNKSRQITTALSILLPERKSEKMEKGGIHMAQCERCGNEYDKTFEVVMGGEGTYLRQ